MNVDKLSPQQLNKVSAMLLNRVEWGEDFNPLLDSQSPDFYFYGDPDAIGTPYSINGRKFFWDPLRNPNDIFCIMDKSKISLVRDSVTGLWDIGEMAFYGYGEYRFTGDVKKGISNEGYTLNKEILKIYIQSKLKLKMGE